MSTCVPSLPCGLALPDVTTLWERAQGFFIDDNWSAHGPSEENHSAVAQCGLSPAEVAHISTAWSDNMAAAQRAIISAGGFNEQLMHGEPL